MTETNPPFVLVKIGGSTLGAGDTSLADIVQLQRAGQRLVVVHGGGPEITSWMAKLGVRAEFIRGLRITDGSGLDVATAVLAGITNKRLVARMMEEGAKASGLSGVDGALLQGTVTDPDLGFVAGRVRVDASPVNSLLEAGYVPVVAPIAVDVERGYQLLNVNADAAAGAIAVALGVAHLVFLTDVDGILDANGQLLQRVPMVRAEGLIGSGVVKGGMIPKLQACMEGRRAGIAAHIVNGMRPGALMQCLDGTSTGTTVV